MKALTVRNVPDDLYSALARLAERNRRSLQQQALVLLEQARVLEVESPVARAADLRRRLSGRQLGNTVSELREERRR
jgi:plasmid stability protein